MKLPMHLRRGDQAPPRPPVYRVRRCRPETPAPQANWTGAAEHWTASLLLARHTTELVHAKCMAGLAAAAAGAPGSPGTPPPAAATHPATTHPDVPDTLALRRAVNASLATQLQFFTECTKAWAGAPRYG